MKTHRSIVRFSHNLAVLNNDHLNIVTFSPHFSYSFTHVMHMLVLFFPPFPLFKEVERGQAYLCWNSRCVD